MKQYKLITIPLTVISCILAITCLISFTVLCINGPKPNLFKSISLLNSTNQQSSAELSESFDYGNGYLKSLVFICDKTIAKIPQTQNMIDKDQVWTGVDGTLDLDYDLPTTSVICYGNELSLTDAIANYTPKYVIITIGLENGVGYCDKETFKQYYGRLIDMIKESSPHTKIIIQSIFPVSGKVSRATPAISNDRINRANSWAAELAEESSVRYLDTASALKDKRGNLNNEYDSGDGITLNNKGVDAVLEYIRTHGYR